MSGMRSGPALKLVIHLDGIPLLAPGACGGVVTTSVASPLLLTEAAAKPTAGISGSTANIEYPSKHSQYVFSHMNATEADETYSFVGSLHL